MTVHFSTLRYLKTRQGLTGHAAPGDAHQVSWDGGRTRGEEPSALWFTHAALGGFVTPLVPLPVCHRGGTSSVHPSHAGYEDRRQSRVWSRVSRRDSL